MRPRLQIVIMSHLDTGDWKTAFLLLGNCFADWKRFYAMSVFFFPFPSLIGCYCFTIRGAWFRLLGEKTCLFPFLYAGVVLWYNLQAVPDLTLLSSVSINHPLLLSRVYHKHVHQIASCFAEKMQLSLMISIAYLVGIYYIELLFDCVLLFSLYYLQS